MPRIRNTGFSNYFQRNIYEIDFENVFDATKFLNNYNLNFKNLVNQASLKDVTVTIAYTDPCTANHVEDRINSLI